MSGTSKGLGMKYDWDENKRKINLRKRKIDFVAAQEVFNDIERIETIDIIMVKIGCKQLVMLNDRV